VRPHWLYENVVVFRGKGGERRTWDEERAIFAFDGTRTLWARHPRAASLFCKCIQFSLSGHNLNSLPGASRRQTNAKQNRTLFERLRSTTSAHKMQVPISEPKIGECSAHLLYSASEQLYHPLLAIVQSLSHCLLSLAASESVISLILSHQMVPKPFTTLEDESEADPAPAVIVVTPYSSGCCIAQEIQNRGFKLICLWHAGIPESMKSHVPVSCQGKLKYDLELNEQSTLEETAVFVLESAQSCRFRIVACICGGDGGVDLADALSEELGLLTNGTDVPNRRDKKVQQELVKAAGLRSIRQVAGKQFEDVQAFLEREKYPVVIKPLDSAGSDGVKLCHTYKEAKEHFIMLTNHHELINGGECQEVLCQEFLKGKEYVVDHVSRHGVHKTCMVWAYDKGNANGAEFIYFGDIPIDSESKEAKLLIPYMRGVLNALGVKNGPSHGEAIITEDGTPCLVECNVRAHGGDGVWQPLCRGLAGYCQIDGAVDSYLYPERFAKLPGTYERETCFASQPVECSVMFLISSFNSLCCR